MIKDGWLNWAERVPGPAAKVYATRNAGEGIACHSMEGWYAGSLAELMRPDRSASWMFSNLVNGKFIQHYPVTDSPWASGNLVANTKLWSVESEGIAGTPLNALQVANMIRLGAEFEAATGRAVSRREPRTIWQHNEVWDWSAPNAGPTACPSNRYAPYFKRIEEEEDMAGISREEFDALRARIAQLETQTWGEADAPRSDKKPYAPMTMYELAQGRTMAQQAAGHTHTVEVTLK